MAVGCLDFDIPTDPVAYTAMAAKAAQIAPRLGAYYVTWTLPCVYWSAPPTPAPHPPVAHGAPPILVVGASLDTQDAYSWSVDMAGQLESAVLLRRVGSGHPSYWNSACVADASYAVTGASDPKTWTITDWISDLVPHVIYGLVTVGTYESIARCEAPQ